MVNHQITLFSPETSSESLLKVVDALNRFATRSKAVSTALNQIFNALVYGLLVNVFDVS